MDRTGDEAEVILVGAGLSGAAVALQLARARVAFIGIDKAPGFGGTGRRGGVGCSVAGSEFQRGLGIQDSVAQALDDLAAEGNTPDRAWARFYYRRAPVDVYGWYRWLGTEFERLMHHEGDSVPRWHRPLGGGSKVLGLAWQKLGELGAQDCWRFGLTVTELIRDGDAVRGVVARDEDGREVRLRGEAVVLATGGFGGNAPLAREVSPRFGAVSRLLAGGNANAQGEMHLLARRHGGVLRNMENVYAYANGLPDYRDPDGARGVVVRKVRSWIWVNREGQRFHDEDVHIAGRTATDNLLDQPGHTCWAVLTQSGLREIEIFDHYIEPLSEPPEDTTRRFLENSPDVVSAATLDGLARKAGIDPAGLAGTVANWTELLEGGAKVDPLTGRKLDGLAPFRPGEAWYAIQLFPLLRKTLGGIATDYRCRVVDADGRPLPNLYAAGELCGMGGGGFAGARPLEGLMAGGSVFSGNLAGRWAARQVLRARTERSRMEQAA